jgi:hypothetical protein
MFELGRNRASVLVSYELQQRGHRGARDEVQGISPFHNTSLRDKVSTSLYGIVQHESARFVVLQVLTQFQA